MNDCSKLYKTLLLISCAIISLVVGFLVSIIICVNNVYAAQVELDSSAFNIKAVKGNSTQNYGQLYLNTNYGDDGYNATCTGNYCTKYYSIYTNRAINSGTYTFELRFWFDYNSSYVTGLRTSDFRFYWGGSQNSITNQFTPDNLSINTVSYGAGGIWDAHQEYVITGNFTYSAANFLEIYIGDTRLNQTSIYVTNLNIYSGDVSGMILSGLGDIVSSNNSNTQSIISNDNTNTQSIINNQNSNNQNVINNNNTNTQSIINNQNSNAQTINDNIKDGLQSCGLNLFRNSYLSIGSISSGSLSPGNDVVSTNRMRTDFIEINSSYIYNYYVSPPYGLYTYFMYYDTDYNLISYVTNSNINTGSITFPSDARYVRFRFAKFDNGVRDDTYRFTQEDIFNFHFNFWSDDECQSKLDTTNDNLSNIDGTLNNINNTLIDSSVSDPTNTINGLNNQIGTNNSVSSLFLLPINLFQIIINGLSSNLCSAINLGSLYGTNLNLPCIDIKARLGSWIYNIIDYLCCFLLIISTGRLFFKVYDGMTSLGDVQNLDGVL